MGSNKKISIISPTCFSCLIFPCLKKISTHIHKKYNFRKKPFKIDNDIDQAEEQICLSKQPLGLRPYLYQRPHPHSLWARTTGNACYPWPSTGTDGPGQTRGRRRVRVTPRPQPAGRQPQSYEVVLYEVRPQTRTKEWLKKVTKKIVRPRNRPSIDQR